MNMTYEELKAMMEKAPKRRRITHPEEDLQKECVRWFRDSFSELSPLLFHPNNEPFFGGRGKSEADKERAGKRAKDMGVVAGVADLILLYPVHPYHALCIEMKTRTGRQSEAQQRWQKEVEKRGFRYEVVRTKDQFRSLMKEYLMKDPRDPDEIAAEKLLGRPVKIHKPIKKR